MRKEMVLITKGGFPFAEGEHRLSREALTFDLERSLKNLQVDCIDLYLLHYDDPTVAMESLMDTLYDYKG